LAAADAEVQRGMRNLTTVPLRTLSRPILAYASLRGKAEHLAEGAADSSDRRRGITSWGGSAGDALSVGRVEQVAVRRDVHALTDGVKKLSRGTSFELYTHSRNDTEVSINAFCT
jgi:hypothetical protein